MFCSNCGAQLNENAKFCKGCGAAVETVPPPAPQYTPPQAPPVQPAQYAPPPPQYAAPPKKGLSKNVILIIIIAAVAVAVVLILVFVLGDRETPPQESPAPAAVEEEDEEPAPAEPEEGTDETEPAGNDMGFTYSYGGSTVFDFVVIQDEYPRGIWSVNQMIGEYGDPIEMSAYYLTGYEMVFVRVDYADFTVFFLPTYVDDFSFANDVYDEGEYEINEADKNIELEINVIRTSSANAKLPHGIKIGQSTRAEIIAAYGEEPAYQYKSEEYDIDMLFYDYAFFDAYGEPLEEYNEYRLGSVEYSFDGNDVVSEVDIRWIYFDL